MHDTQDFLYIARMAREHKNVVKLKEALRQGYGQQEMAKPI